MNKKPSLIEQVRTFNKERDWEQYHTFKDLASAISIETCELQEHFLWKSASHELPPDKKEQIEQELADIYLFLLMFCDKAHIDLEQVAEQKILQNSKKYPKEKVKGSSKKYTEY